MDAHLRGHEIPRRANVYISVGHDEYWSGLQRRHVEKARDAGRWGSWVAVRHGFGPKIKVKIAEND